jgi:steroid delta-isomerase-like uncharacterized protein
MNRRIRVLSGLVLVLCAGTAACAGSVQEHNKAVARRVFDDIFNRNQFQVAQDIYAPDFINHGLHGSVGLKEDQAAARGWKSAFPDLVMSVDKLIAEGNLVSVLWVARGTNTGEGNGLPATGRKAEGRGITIWRIVDGTIREEWSEFDPTYLMQQLGLMPESAVLPGTTRSSQ